MLSSRVCPRPCGVRTATLLLAALAATLGACDKLDERPPREDTSDSAEIVLDDPLGLDVVLDPSAAESLPGLARAASDVALAFAAVVGKSVGPGDHVVASLDEVDAPRFVQVVLDPTRAEALGPEGYVLDGAVDGGAGRTGIVVTAADPRGAMYGLYDVTMRFGVRYHHPEQTFFPSRPDLELPGDELDGTYVPDFVERGFHEHTQHPTEFADFYMVADPAHRPYLTHYFHWLARNRQNTAAFILLKTIDKATWLPYITEVIEEAHGYGLRLGFVLSYADQQQNGHKLVRDDSRPADEWIREGIDELAATGVDFLVLQYGTSEFTRPPDAVALGWQDTAQRHVAENYPDLELANWIHIACDVHDDAGNLYYHLPLRSDPSFTAWVHTTMFYTLEHPAPVYECEDFKHQLAFMQGAQDQGRRQVFFPETAWWLGFDNNMPVALPITGWSRSHDIDKVLSAYEVEGHVTFTSGREWNYWQYDHFLTRATWDRDFTWDDYAAWMEPVWGQHGAAAREALLAFTALQVRDFYERDPLIYFYIAGELAQDEIGEAAGVLARRPKLSYRKVYEMDDAAFEAWRANDLERLRGMREDYAAVFEAMPEPELASLDLDERLYRELWASFALFVLRLEHSVVLYDAVAATRSWRAEQLAAAREQREPDESIRDAALTAAQDGLAAARALSDQAHALILASEELYRYPLELLVEPRENLTVYPFGYVHETHTAHFWHRRDDQLERHIARAFDPSSDAWSQEPDLVFLTDAQRTEMLVPDDVIAGGVIASFVPRLLFGMVDHDPIAGTLDVLVGEDENQNLIVDEGTEQRFSGTIDTSGTRPRWSAPLEGWALRVIDDAGELLGTLTLSEGTMRIELTLDDHGLVSGVGRGEAEGTIVAQELVTMVVSVGGIDEDGATNLIKGIYDVPEGQPLPERLPVHFRFRYEKVE